MWPISFLVVYLMITHKHTTLHYIHLTAFFSGQPGKASTRKAEPFWKNQSGFTGARDSEWQWHQLGDMQICTLL